MAVLNAEVEGRALAAIRTLARLGSIRAVYVFGSQVEGQAGEWSDIDVAFFMDEVENWDIQRRARAMALVMEEAGSGVEAHLFPVSALETPERGAFAEYILQHGVRIFG